MAKKRLEKENPFQRRAVEQNKIKAAAHQATVNKKKNGGVIKPPGKPKANAIGVAVKGDAVEYLLPVDEAVSLRVRRTKKRLVTDPTVDPENLTPAQQRGVSIKIIDVLSNPDDVTKWGFVVPSRPEEQEGCSQDVGASPSPR